MAAWGDFMDAYAHLRQPIAIGPITARNRIMMTTHGPRLSQARYVRYLEERAKGGIGLAGFNLGPMGIMQFPLGPGHPHMPSAGDVDAIPPHPLTEEGRKFYDAMIPAMREQSAAVKRHGALSIGQLYHPGGAQHTDTYQPVVGPSVVMDDYERHNPHALTVEEIADLIHTYALAAERTVKAGFDGIELHAAHGYIGEQFLSPMLNTRQDKYGGSLENRMRFLMETIQAVRGAIKDAVPVGLRLTGPQPEGGLTLSEIVEIARRSEAAGMAYISMSGGTYSGLLNGAHTPYVAPAFVAPGPNVPVSAAVKQAVKVPVMVAGRIADMDFAEKIVADGKADIVGMVRGLIADPRLIEKAFAGKGERAIPCIACNDCHYGRPVACSVNPTTGREAAMEPRMAQGRRILVIGAGPAGMECAAAAARRGHHVTLVDRGKEVGGMLSTLAYASEQTRFADYVTYMTRTLAELPIDIVLGKNADVEYVKWLAPDAVVVATGATYQVAASFGNGTVDATTALMSPDRLGKRVAVAAGKDDHLPGLVVADYLARSGRSVTLFCEIAAPGQAVEPASLNIFLKRLTEHGVVMRPLTAAVRLSGKSLTVRHVLTRLETQVSGIDNLVVVDGRQPVDGLAAQLKGVVGEIHVIGDALSPRRMLHATLDGARLGRLEI
jgi:2,4-dienoyl-CoA reductase-like NADH-dependent reductase (Old Yellow Enzyme family)/thioredoxin reductase